MSSPRTRKRRLFRFFVALFVIALIARVAVPLALPSALASWAEGQGLRAEYEELDLSLLTGEVELWHLTLVDDSIEATPEELVHLEYVTLDLDMASLLTGRPRIARVEADGLDLRVERTADGELRFGQSSEIDEAVADEPEGEAEVDTADGGPVDLILPFELAALRVQEVRVDVLDRTVEPPLRTKLELGVRLSDLGSKTRSARAEVRLSATDILDAMSLDLVQTGDASELKVRTEVAIDGFHPRAVSALLEPLGIAPRAQSIGFRLAAELDVRAGTLENPATSISFEVSETEVLVDAHAPFSIEEISGGLSIGAAAMRVEEVLVNGVRGEVTRLPNGSLLAMGLELGSSSGAAGAETEAPADEAKTETSASSFTLESLVVQDAAFDFHDSAIEPATDVELLMSELRLSNLQLGTTGSESVATLSARLALPGIVEALFLDGEVVVPAPKGRLDLALRTEGIRLERIEPYLAAAGIRSQFENGEFGCQIEAELVSSEHGLAESSFALRELSLTDGGNRLFGIDRLGVSGVEVTDERVRLADIEFAGLELPVNRNQTGGLELAGIELLAATPAASSESDAPKSDSTVDETPTSTTVAKSAPEEPATVLELGRFVWRDTSVRYTDVSVVPPVELALADLLLEIEGVVLGGEAGVAAPPATLVASLSMEGIAEQLAISGSFDEQAERFLFDLGVNLAVDRGLIAELKTIEVPLGEQSPMAVDVELSGSLGRVATGEAIPAQFGMTLRVGGAIEELALAGVLVLDGEDLTLESKLRGRGIRRGELKDFLPEGLEVTLQDGRLDAALSAGMQSIGEDAQRAWFELSEFNYADGETSLTKFDRASVVLSELNAAAGRFTIEELVVRGLEADVRKPSSDRMEVGGFALVPSRASELNGEPVAPSEEGEAAEGDAPTISSASSRVDLELLPTVTLASLDVGISRLGYWDLSQPESERLDVTLALTNPKPLTLLDQAPDELPPIELIVRGSANPILDAIGLDLTISPYNDPPRFDAELAITGIQGAGIERVLPELANTLDAHELENGSFEAKWVSSIKWRRRGPLDFDLANGFGAELRLSEIAFRAQPEGEVLLGLTSVDVEVANVNPATGDVHLRSVEISTPILHAKQSAQGLHVLGMILKPAPEDTEAEEDAVVDEQNGAVALEASASVEEEPSSSEFRLDKLLVEGLDVRFVDETVSPVMTIPLNQLDVELIGFTTKAFEEERTLRYAVHLGAGEVPLPERTERSFLGGLAHAATDLVGANGEVAPSDARALFEEFSVNGRLSFYPALKGRTKIELNALELLGLEGAAAQSGVTIGDGVMDSTIAIKLKGEDGIEVESTTNFAHLSLDEPADGPISRYLKLPAPLDAVLFVLKNDDGEQSIPLNFDLASDGDISGGEIAGVATSTLVKIIADAIASSPLRILGSVTDVAGLTGDEPEDPTENSVRVGFAAAETALDEGSSRELATLLEYLDDEDELTVVVQHELGSEDALRAAVLANPDPEDCRNLARRLRAKKSELEDAREHLAAEARAHYAVGRLELAAKASTQLRAMDDELGRTEDSLDYLYAFLRPGSERGADKRTRTTCLDIAEQRLELVRRALIEGGLAPERIDVRNARFQFEEGRTTGGVQLIPKR